MSNYALKIQGEVTAPADMIDAARRSLSNAGFEDLMNQLGQQTPSPAQLCAAVELERSQHRAS